jgi:hypothetical protein
LGQIWQYTPAIPVLGWLKQEDRLNYTGRFLSQIIGEREREREKHFDGRERRDCFPKPSWYFWRICCVPAPGQFNSRFSSEVQF